MLQVTGVDKLSLADRFCRKPFGSQSLCEKPPKQLNLHNATVCKHHSCTMIVLLLMDPLVKRERNPFPITSLCKGDNVLILKSFY